MEQAEITTVHHIHLTAVGGVGMASLAAMLRERGHTVTGSDQGVYPPMSDFLATSGVSVMEGYRPENLVPRPDLVVVGNAVSRANPEVKALLAAGIPHLSLPQALSRLFLRGKRPLVVAGTHGKTTTATLLAWVLDRAGRDPGFFAGGIGRDYGRGYRLGGGDLFVVEGDEYDSAFFDKEPKFLHYGPQALLLNAVEFDHADIYRDLGQVKTAFGKLLGILPAGAPALVCGDFPAALEVALASGRPFSTFGFAPAAEWQARDVRDDGRRMRFTMCRRGKRVRAFEIALMGMMNVRNALGAAAVAVEIGLSPDEIAPGLATFSGVKRRQEVLGEAGGITVVDDFAHHPTAARATLEAVRSRYGGRRLWAVFEPRSNTCRRRVFQKDLVSALSVADRVIVAPVYAKPQDTIEAEQLFSPGELASDVLASGREACAPPSIDDVLATLTGACRPGDVVVFMSNGAFGELPQRLLSVFGAERPP